MRRFLCVLAFLALATPVAAQTTTSLTAKWHQVEAMAQVPTIVFTLYNANLAQNGVLQGAALTPVCAASVAPATGSDCSAPLSPAMAAAGGAYALCARFATAVTMACSDSLPPLGAAPGKPGSFVIVTDVRITSTTTVTPVAPGP